MLTFHCFWSKRESADVSVVVDEKPAGKAAKGTLGTYRPNKKVIIKTSSNQNIIFADR